jgi:ABC-2 type transport system ATP-binding protein
MEGQLPDLSASLRDQFSLIEHGEGRVTIDTRDDLSPLLGWLSTLPLEEIRIEPIGLRAVYDRYHAEGASATEQGTYGP